MYNYWYGDTPIRWTNSYYVGTAGTVTAETIKKYIEEQKSR
jgi:putative transposase